MHLYTQTTVMISDYVGAATLAERARLGLDDDTIANMKNGGRVRIKQTLLITSIVSDMYTLKYFSEKFCSNLTLMTISHYSFRQKKSRFCEGESEQRPIWLSFGSVWLSFLSGVVQNLDPGMWRRLILVASNSFKGLNISCSSILQSKILLTPVLRLGAAKHS